MDTEVASDPWAVLEQDQQWAYRRKLQYACLLGTIGTDIQRQGPNTITRAINLRIKASWMVPHSAEIESGCHTLSVITRRRSGDRVLVRFSPTLTLCSAEPWKRRFRRRQTVCSVEIDGGGPDPFGTWSGGRIRQEEPPPEKPSLAHHLADEGRHQFCRRPAAGPGGAIARRISMFCTWLHRGRTKRRAASPPSFIAPQILRMVGSCQFAEAAARHQFLMVMSTSCSLRTDQHRWRASSIAVRRISMFNFLFEVVLPGTLEQVPRPQSAIIRHTPGRPHANQEPRWSPSMMGDHCAACHGDISVGAGKYTVLKEQEWRAIISDDRGVVDEAGMLVPPDQPMFPIRLLVRVGHRPPDQIARQPGASQHCRPEGYPYYPKANNG